MYLGRTLGRNPSRADLKDKIDVLERAIQSLIPARAPGLLLKHTAAGVSRTALKQQTPIEIRRLQLVSVQDDHLECLDVDSEEEVKVAKPWKLQRTPWDTNTIDVGGTSITYAYTSGSLRTATSGSDSETQQITPSYLPDIDWIFAIQPKDGTGVEVEVEGETEEVIWQDMNTDGRAWAKV